MKRLIWAALAFGVLGTVVLFARPLDISVSLRGHHEPAAVVRVDPGEAHAQTAEQGLQALRSQSQAFVQISKQVLPSVVTIVSERTVEVTGNPGNMRFFGDDFFDRFFQSPGGGGQQRIPQTGSGSGVVVSKDGYILTNNHVVANADKIHVTLQDGRQFEGELVGRDPKSDVAVIRVKANDLVPAGLGDSDELQVGEWVLAVGNPFQLSSTVTAGIVSATGRSNIGLADYEDFIQTDAAINPGNSGGALVDLDGKVVGINTAIATRTGGYQGIGFAIPMNMARKVMDSLISTGKVVRGWLGVNIQNLNENTAEAFGLERARGALVGQAVPGGPAEKAGLRQGDVIVTFDGKEVKDVEDLQLKVVDESPGTKVDLGIIRDRKSMTIPVKLGELEDKGPAGSKGSGSNAEPQRSHDLGLNLDDLTPSARRQLDLPAEVDGVLVTDVDPTGIAGQAGLQRGDVIMKIGSAEVRNVRSFEQALQGAPTGKPVLFLVRRQDAEIFLGVRLPK